MREIVLRLESYCYGLENKSSTERPAEVVQLFVDALKPTTPPPLDAKTGEIVRRLSGRAGLLRSLESCKIGRSQATPIPPETVAAVADELSEAALTIEALAARVAELEAKASPNLPRGQGRDSG